MEEVDRLRQWEEVTGYKSPAEWKFDDVKAKSAHEREVGRLRAESAKLRKALKELVGHEESLPCGKVGCTGTLCEPCKEKMSELNRAAHEALAV